MRHELKKIRRARGFTLVEIMAAMALAVMVMVGVAQIFKMSSEAVAAAEAVSQQYQLGRGALNMLQYDLSRQTGYLAVVTGQVKASLTFGGSSYAGSRGIEYPFDTLIFPIVGTVEEMGTDLPSSQRPAVSTGAEVVYTLGGRATSGTRVRPYVEVETNKDDDPRTMLLVRKAFLMSGSPNYTGYSLPGLAVNAPVTGGRGCLALMTSDRWNEGKYSKYRVAAPPYIAVNNAKDQPLVHVEPQVDSSGFPVYQPDVNVVVCDRISEFRVETWEKGRRGNHAWQRVSPAETHRYRPMWCGNTQNPNNAYQKYMPKMIRVTLVVHPHNDTALLRQESYAGDIPSGYPRKYRGMVFRQVFRINGLVMTE